MIPTSVKRHRDRLGTDGEIRTGWASWDKGHFKDRSIKWAYRDASGKVSRGSPEVPLDVLVEMIIVALEQQEISPEDLRRLKRSISSR
jgi:hypothetical protein